MQINLLSPFVINTLCCLRCSLVTLIYSNCLASNWNISPWWLFSFQCTFYSQWDSICIFYWTGDWKVFLYFRFGISPTGWYTAGPSTCYSTLHSANPFYHTFRALIPWGHMDNKHSWLHPWQAMALDGCWLSHYSPHHIPT